MNLDSYANAGAGLIAICGRKGAGKDTLAASFIRGSGYKQFRFADPLKAMLKTMLTFTDATPTEIDRMIDGDLKEVPSKWLGDKTPREAMQYLGTEWRDLLDTDLWTKMFLFRLTTAGKNSPNIVTDCRFKHEFEMISKIGGVVIKIHRNHDATIGSQHVSETEQNEIVADIEVFNYGSLEDLDALIPFIENATVRKVS